MKKRFIFTALLIGVLAVTIGAALSFFTAYVFVRPDAKFTGYGAFQLGLMASTWWSTCLTLSFLTTGPFYLGRFGERSWRHVLTYAAIFVAFVLFVMRWPLIQGFMHLLWKVMRALNANELVMVLLVPLSGFLLVALAFCGLAHVALMPFRRRVTPTEHPQTGAL